jgi:hypothetical protein
LTHTNPTPVTAIAPSANREKSAPIGPARPIPAPRTAFPTTANTTATNAGKNTSPATSDNLPVHQPPKAALRT